MIETKHTDTILFTGAGFTKNFGGFLADEMWSLIFNNPLVQESPLLREQLLGNSDFEAVYFLVTGILEEATDDDKSRLNQAVFEAYQQLDDATSQFLYTYQNPYLVSWEKLKELVNLFRGSGSEKGFFFTLNQDLVMERRLQLRSAGAPHFPEDTYAPGKARSLSPAAFKRLPETNIETLMENDIRTNEGLAYIKLHGSYGWKSSEKNENQLVIGEFKESTISKEPLLRKYLDLFRSLIAEGNKKMLIIGYGFRDKHINGILSLGVEHYGLRLYVISTQRPSDLHLQLKGPARFNQEIIFQGLGGYFPYAFKEIIPSASKETIHFQNIKKIFLRN